MANKLFAILCGFGLISGEAFCQPDLSCDLGHGHFLKLKQTVNEESPNSRFWLEINSQATPALSSDKGILHGTAEGDIHLSTCIKNTYLLVVDTGSVRSPGVAIRLNQKTKAIEKIYFAEKGNPRFIRNSGDDFAVIFDYVDYDITTNYVQIAYKNNHQHSLSYPNNIAGLDLITLPDSE